MKLHYYPTVLLFDVLCAVVECAASIKPAAAALHNLSQLLQVLSCDDSVLLFLQQQKHTCYNFCSPNDITKQQLASCFPL